MFDNVLTEEDPPVQTTYGDRIRFAIAALLALASAYLAAINIALRIGA